MAKIIIITQLANEPIPKLISRFMHYIITIIGLLTALVTKAKLFRRNVCREFKYIYITMFTTN